MPKQKIIRGILDKNLDTIGGLSDFLGLLIYSDNAPYLRSQIRRTYSPPTSGWGSTACGRRALSRGGSAGVSSPAGIYQQTPTAACASDAAAPITGGLGAIGHQQAAPGIYRCIACHYYQCL